MMHRQQPENLSSFTKMIMNQVLNEHPDWKVHMQFHSYTGSHDFGSHYVIFAIPAKNGIMPPSELIISTKLEEITVSFDCFHQHFSEWFLEGDDVENDAKYFVDDILSEKIATISWWQDDQCKASSIIEVPYQNLPKEDYSFSNIRIRSWNGRFDENKYFA